MHSMLAFFRSSFWLSAGQITALKMPHPLSSSPSQILTAPSPAEGQVGEVGIRWRMKGLEESVLADKTVFSH